MNIGLFFLEMEEGREHNFISLISCVSLFGLLGIGEFLFFPRKKKNEEKAFFSDFYFLFFLVFGLQRKCESLLGCAESGGKEEKMEGFYFYSFFSWFMLF